MMSSMGCLGRDTGVNICTALGSNAGSAHEVWMGFEVGIDMKT